MACRLSRALAGSFALAFLISPAFAQYGTTTTTDVQPNNYPPALPERRGPGPVLVFAPIGEIVLPGPLAGGTAWLADGRVSVPVESGVARVTPEAGADAVVEQSAGLPADPEWVVAKNGKHRFRTTQEGLVEAEARAHTRRGWRRSWHIIAPNSIFAPPILVGPRLCYVGLDDRVTCVRASNGHRLWAVDLGDRLSRGLATWPASVEPSPDGGVLLAVPDDGASVVALDAYDGRRIATYELPLHQHFASPALVVAGDRIAIARKGYDDKEAALVLLSLIPPPPAPASPVPYNDGSTAHSDFPGR